MEFQPTWAQCDGCGCGCAKHGPFTLALTELIPEGAPVWIERRPGAVAIVWCRCGTQPAPPELRTWHNQRFKETLRKDGRNGDSGGDGATGASA